MPSHEGRETVRDTSPMSAERERASTPSSDRGSTLRRRRRWTRQSRTPSYSSYSSYSSYTSSSRSGSVRAREQEWGSRGRRSERGLGEQFEPSASPRSRRQRRYRRDRSRSHSRSGSQSRSRSNSGSLSYRKERNRRLRSRSRSRSRSPYWRHSHSRSRSGSRSPSRSYSYSSRSVSPLDRGRDRANDMRDDDYERTRDIREQRVRDRSWARPRSRTPSPGRGLAGGYGDGRGVRRSGRGAGGRRRRRRNWRRGLARGRLMPTVLVTQLGQKVGRDDIGRLFSRAGHVRDVRMVSDRRTGRHKGAAYVEFDDDVGVAAAVRLTGMVLCGVPITVRAWDEGGRGEWRGGVVGNGDTGEGNSGGVNNAEVSIGWTNRIPMRGVEKVAPERVIVPKRADVPAPVSELVSVEELKRLLNPNGLETTGYSRATASALTGGRAVTSEAAKGSKTQGLQRVPLPVATGVDTATRVYVGGLTRRVDCDELKRIFGVFGEVVLGEMESNDSGNGNSVAVVEFVNADAAKKAVEQKNVKVNGEQVGIYSKRGDVKTEVGSGLDQAGDGGVNLNWTRRAILMQQLSRGEGVTGRRLSGDERRLETSNEKSRALLLSNMFDPTKESEGFEQDVAEDVRDECATQYGKVTHVHVEKESHGLVYVQFESVDSAEKAMKALNGRWFGGNKIGAGFVADAVYEGRFSTKADEVK